MAQKGFLLRAVLCYVGVVITVKRKIPTWKSEEEEEEDEGTATDGALPMQRRVAAAMSSINKVEALWTFGGVLNSLAGNHRGRT